jgi:peptidyl-prolyl cis-trans isomerase D
MLHFMRRFASTWIGKILGGLLLIGLAGFGISNVILDLGSTTLVKVGDEDITTTQFQRLYQLRLNQLAQQTGQMPTSEQALAMGVPTAVLDKLAGDSAVNQFAVRQGIGVSDAELGRIVRADPNFQNQLGQFDRGAFTQALSQNGYTEAEYFDLETRVARQEQLQLGLFDGVSVPKTAEELLHRYRNDTRTVEYFTLNETSIPDVGTPTDADLKKFLADHQADYRTKETRTIDVMALTPEILAADAKYQPTEDQIKAEYESTKSTLTKPEKRQIQQVALTDPSKEEFFKPGTSFADDLKASGLTATDFGLLSKGDVIDGTVADAAYGLAKEGDFTIIPGIGGKRVIAVTKIEGGGTTSYEEAKPDIAKRLAVAKAKNDYADIQDEIESLRAALKPLKDIAARYNIPMATVALTAGGSELSSYPAIAEADRAKVASGAFAATVGKLAPTVAITATNNVWFDLTKIDPARDQTFDEVKDKLAAAWTAQKTAEALNAEVAKITAELDAGKPFQDVAAERSQFATVSQPITRDGDKTNVLTQQVASQIFSGGPDSHGSAIDGDGEYVIFHVVDVTAAQGEPDKNVADFLENSQRQGLNAAFIGGLREQAGLKNFNQQALAQLLGLGQPAQ